MSPMLWFIIGIVIGGLSLWVYMREHELRLLAEIEALEHREIDREAAQPAVKTRTIGEGGAREDTTKRARPIFDGAEEQEAGEPGAEPVPEAAEPFPEEDNGEEEGAGQKAKAAETGEEEPAEKESKSKKKPAISLKIPEPSSVSEVRDDQEE